MRKKAISIGFIAAALGIALLGTCAWNLSRNLQRRQTTEQAIWTLVRQLDQMARTNSLPESEAELNGRMVGGLPLDGWGSTVHYQPIEAKRFKVYTISPWPTALVFEYDSARPSAGISAYFF